MVLYTLILWTYTYIANVTPNGISCFVNLFFLRDVDLVANTSAPVASNHLDSLIDS